MNTLIMGIIYIFSAPRSNNQIQRSEQTIRDQLLCDTDDPSYKEFIDSLRSSIDNAVLFLPGKSDVM